MEEASFCGRCWAVSYCLTWDLTHLVPHGAQQKKKNRRIPQLFDRKQFCFYFLCLVYFKTDPRRALLVPPEADCTPQIAFCWLSELLLDWKSLWAVPVPAFSTLPSLLPLYGEAALTSWWSWVAARLPWTPIKYWCLAFCAGWLTKDELYETERERSILERMVVQRKFA